MQFYRVPELEKILYLKLIIWHFLENFVKMRHLTKGDFMLIQFSVKNWRSIRKEQTLSLVMAKGDELAASNSFKCVAPATTNLLRSLAIYGANASGKSNVINAMKTMENIVLESASKWQQGDHIPVVPFLLDSDTENEPSEFETIFIAEGVRYQYGFSATPERIIEEWLLAYPLGRAQRWFSRVWDNDTNYYSWEFGNALTGQKQLWQESTRENGLFLSTAVQLNSQQLKPIYDWFKKSLRFADTSLLGPEFTADLCQKEEKKKEVLAFLKAADLNIDNLVVETEKFSVKHLPDDIPDDTKRTILAKMKDNEVFDIKTIHHSTQGKLITFDFDEESEGTQTLFSVAGPWLDTLQNGFVLFIDELHNNLHPKIVEFLVQLFHSNVTNPNNAQLIFTTHETSILSQDIFRRDQIWFCEKDKDQATQLYPLTDFSPRKGREKIEASYLAGRYGALPYTRDLKLVKEAQGGD